MNSQDRIINTWTDIINLAIIGMEVIYKCNVHKFPLDLAAMDAPSINGFFCSNTLFESY